MQFDTVIGTRTERGSVQYDPATDTVGYAPESQLQSPGTWVRLDAKLNEDFGVGDYDAYQRVVDLTGVFGFDAPVAWSDVTTDTDGQTWSGVAAAPDLESFWAGTGSGTMVIAYATLGAFQVGDLLAGINPTACTLVDVRSVSTPNGFWGAGNVYAGCGGSTALQVYSVVRDPYSVLTFLVVQVLADGRDQAAGARLLNSLSLVF